MTKSNKKNHTYEFENIPDQTILNAYKKRDDGSKAVAKSSRKYLKLLIFFLIIAILAGLGFRYYLQTQADTAARPNLATVETGTIEEVVTAQGTLEPKEYVDVGAQVSGQLENLAVDIGDEVTAGQLIAEIDAKVFESQVAADEARLKTMQAQKAQTEAEIRQAQQKLDRNTKLIASNAISREILEDSQTALDIANARLLSLDAQIEEAESTLEGNKASLNYTKIYAPINGTIVSLSAKEGQTLNANQTTPIIVQIAQLGTMTVKAQVAEADINKIDPGMNIYFTTLGSQGRRWEGTVRQVLPTPEIVNDVVLYNVLIDVENADGKLMSGMTTQVFFVLGRAENVPVIPAGALVKRAKDKPDGKKGTAYLVNVLQNGVETEKTVLIGLSDRANAEVLEGLSPGDQVVIPAPKAASAASSSGGRMRMPRL